MGFLTDVVNRVKNAVYKLPTTPQKQEVVNQQISQDAGGNDFARKVGQGLNNWLVAPAMQIPYNLQEATKARREGRTKDWIFGMGKAIGGAIPGVDDIAIAGLNALKNKASGGSFSEGLAGNEFAGLGDVAQKNFRVSDSTANLLNTAEIPLLLLAGGVKAKSAAKSADKIPFESLKTIKPEEKTIDLLSKEFAKHTIDSNPIGPEIYPATTHDKIVSQFTKNMQPNKDVFLPETVVEKPKTVIEPGVSSSLDPRSSTFVPPVKTEVDAIKETAAIPTSTESILKPSSKPNLDIVVKPGTSKYGELSKANKVKDSIFLSNRAILKENGASAAEAARRVDEAITNGKIYAGKRMDDYNTVTKGMSDESIGRVLDSLRGAPVQLTTQEMLAASKLRQIFDETLSQAQAAGIDVAKIENYVPQIIDVKKLESNRNKTIDHLVQTGQMSAKDAPTFVDQIIKGESPEEVYRKFFPNHAPKKYGSLDFQRNLDLPADVLRNDKALLPEYIEGSAARIAKAEQFGANNEVFGNIMGNVAAEGGDIKTVENSLNQSLDLINNHSDLKALINQANSAMAMKTMPFAAVTNSTQGLVNNAAKFGVRRTLKGYYDMFTNFGLSEKNALRSGNTLNEVMYALETDVKGKGWLRRLTAPGFRKMEKINRIVTSNIGRSFVEDNFEQLMKNPSDVIARKNLEQMGVNIEEAITNGGLREIDLLKASQKANDITQFNVNKIDLPPTWNTDVGTLLTFLKKFSYKQTGFIKNVVVKPALSGNLGPMMKYVSFAIAAGEVNSDIRALITAKDRPEELKDRLFEDFLRGGGAGLPLDVYQNMQFGTSALVKNFAGPVIGEGIKTAENVEKLVKQGNGKPLAKQAVGWIPLIGQTMANIMFPAQKYTPSTQPNPLVRKTADMLSGNAPAGGQPNLISKLLSPLKTQLPTKDSNPKQWSEFNAIVKETIDNGELPPDDQLKAYLFGKNEYDPAKIVDRNKILKQLYSKEDDYAFNPALLDKALTLSGVDKLEYAYYKATNMDELEKGQMFLKLADSMDHTALMQSLYEGKVKIGDKQLTTSTLLDYLYDNNIISKAEKAYLGAVKFDQEKGGFYMDRDYDTTGGAAAKAKTAAYSLLRKNNTITTLKKRSKPTLKVLKTQKAPKQKVNLTSYKRI